MQVTEPDAALAEIAEQGRDAGALGLRVIGVDEFGPIGRKRNIVPGKLGRNRFDPVVEVKSQLPT